MWRVAIWLVGLGLFAGCAPDYADTAFLCTVDGDCPADQGCAGGRCKLGGAIGDGVRCGAITCTSAEQCCVDGINAPRCVRGGGTCPGRGAMCDGVEDCPTGTSCCQGNLEIITCGPRCDSTVCHDDADCPAALPRCCFHDPTVPWGTCFFLC